MGSLVPGWDSEMGIPRDLVPDELNIEKEPEPEGYFARLRSHRISHGGDEAGSLARTSAPVARTSSIIGPYMPSTQRAATMNRTSLPYAAAHQPETDGSVRHRLTHHEPPHKYLFTDWTLELSSLRGGRDRHGSLSGLDDKHGGHGPEGSASDGHGAAWWRSLEVGHLNEHPNGAEGDGRGGHSTTFVPQCIAQHQLDFGDKDKDKEGA